MGEKVSWRTAATLHFCFATVSSKAAAAAGGRPRGGDLNGWRERASLGGPRGPVAVDGRPCVDPRDLQSGTQGWREDPSSPAPITPAHTAGNGVERVLGWSWPPSADATVLLRERSPSRRIPTTAAVSPRQLSAKSPGRPVMPPSVQSATPGGSRLLGARGAPGRRGVPSLAAIRAALTTDSPHPGNTSGKETVHASLGSILFSRPTWLGPAHGLGVMW